MRKVSPEITETPKGKDIRAAGKGRLSQLTMAPLSHDNLFPRVKRYEQLQTC